MNPNEDCGCGYGVVRLSPENIELDCCCEGCGWMG